jgi:hypothetical protein
MNGKMYIAVLDEFPDYMTPTLVAHSVLEAHIRFQGVDSYQDWLHNSFKKCVVRVNRKEFDKICELDFVYIGYELHTMDSENACVVVCPTFDGVQVPNVLKFAKLWAPLPEQKEGK